MRIALFHEAAKCFEKLVRLGKVFTVGFFSFKKVRRGVYSKTIDTKIQPVRNDVEHRLPHFRIVVVEIRLVTKKAMPVEGFCLLVPGPIRMLSVTENDS